MGRPKETDSQTAAKILKSARQFFLKKGFAGTSINDIAQDAGIHKSLIYHHFDSKEGLWRAVKSDVLESYTREPLEKIILDDSNLKALLMQIVTLRFRFYKNNPDIVRLMGWQNLEPASERLQGIAKGQLNSIAPQLRTLQKKGQVRKDIDLEMASYFVMSAASNPFKDRVPFLLGADQKEKQDQYLSMLIDFLFRALTI